MMVVLRFAVIVPVVVVISVVLVVVFAAGLYEIFRQQFHAALGATVGLVAGHLWVHRTDVGRLFCGLGKQLHSAFRTAAGFSGDDVGMHRADVDDVDAFRDAHVH